MRPTILAHAIASLMVAAVAQNSALAQCSGPTRLDTLDASSTFTEQQCLPPCACISAPQTGPLTGTLSLCLDHQDADNQYYNVTADLFGSRGVGPVMHLTGPGLFTLGQPPTTHQQLTLDLTSDAAVLFHFDSGQVALGSAVLPSITISASTPVQGCTQYTLAVSAAVSCRADFNGVGGLNVQDIFDFLSAWFAGDVRADFNGAGGITVQDIFDFLSAWFAGC